MPFRIGNASKDASAHADASFICVYSRHFLYIMVSLKNRRIYLGREQNVEILESTDYSYSINGDYGFYGGMR
jgi:hypothetical protein